MLYLLLLSTHLFSLAFLYMTSDVGSYSYLTSTDELLDCPRLGFVPHS